MDDIKNEVVGNLNSRCCSGITAGLVTDSRFVCLDNSRAAISFRAKLHGSSRYSVQFLHDGLEEWLNITSSSIIIRSIEYNLDVFCTRILDKPGQDTCSYPVVITSNTDSMTQPTSHTTTSANMTTTTAAIPFIFIYVGGAAAVLVVLILAVVCGVVICVIVYARSKRPAENLT